MLQRSETEEQERFAEQRRQVEEQISKREAMEAEALRKRREQEEQERKAEEHIIGIEERANELREQLKEMKKKQEKEEKKKAEEEEASLLRQRRATEDQDRKEADGDEENSVFALMPCASLEMPIGHNVWALQSETMLKCIQKVLAARRAAVNQMNADSRYLPFRGQKEVTSTSSFSSSDPSSFLPSPLPPFPPSFLTSSPPYFLPSLTPSFPFLLLFYLSFSLHSPLLKHRATYSSSSSSLSCLAGAAAAVRGMEEER